MAVGHDLIDAGLAWRANAQRSRSPSARHVRVCNRLDHVLLNDDGIPGIAGKNVHALAVPLPTGQAPPDSTAEQNAECGAHAAGAEFVREFVEHEELTAETQRTQRKPQ